LTIARCRSATARASASTSRGGARSGSWALIPANGARVWRPYRQGPLPQGTRG
jgi:hypothetical protein